jgi:hypothetical protein
MMCLWASYKKKYEEKNIFFASLYSKSDPDLDPDPDLLFIGTDPRIRIRSKMTRILNIGSKGRNGSGFRCAKTAPTAGDNSHI